MIGCDATDDDGELEKNEVRFGSSSDSSGAIRWSFSATNFEIGRVTDLVRASKLRSQLEGLEFRSLSSNLKLREFFFGLWRESRKLLVLNRDVRPFSGVLDILLLFVKGEISPVLASESFGRSTGLKIQEPRTLSTLSNDSAIEARSCGNKPCEPLALDDSRNCWVSVCRASSLRLSFMKVECLARVGFGI